jgi:hypothetical protein
MNAANIEPMIIEQPGIPGKLRSQTLDEYMAALIPEHPARAELAQIRAMALEGMKSAHALAEALQKIQKLEEQIKSLQAQPPVTAPIEAEAAKNFVCKECGRALASLVGLQRHILFKHGKDYKIKNYSLVDPPPEPK